MMLFILFCLIVLYGMLIGWRDEIRSMKGE